jgi:FMN phosphatase YigB (HAD superfamily)
MESSSSVAFQRGSSPANAPDERWTSGGASDALASWEPDNRWLEAFDAALEDVDVVSFDVFDTALTRAVDSPCDVFALVEARLVSRFGEKARGFAGAREEAERDARPLANAATGAEDVTLADIYERLRLRLPALGVELKAAQEEELETEAALMLGVPDVLRAFAAARTKGKRLLFVSDMYLPSRAIARMLGAAGFEGWHDLFVSSEIGRTKGSGRIWRGVEKRHGPLNRILHIGDDRWSDAERPQQLGLRVLPYQRARCERRVGAVLTPDVLPFSVAARAGALRLRTAPGADPGTKEFFSELGAGFGALVVGTFLRWLSDRAQRLRLEHLYFCARDGWLMQEAWNAAGLGASTGISSSYLYLSRRPLNLAGGYTASATGTPSDELLNFLTGSWRTLPLRTMLERAGLLECAPLVSAAVEAFGSLDALVSWPDGPPKLRRILEQYPEDVILACQPAYEATLGYMVQEGLALNRPAALVDMGWHGTLQASVRRLLRFAGHSSRLCGFYYGLWPGARGRRPATGWMESLFCSDFVPWVEQPAIHQAVEFLEELHAAPHGTVLGFQRGETKQWLPVLGESPVEVQQHASATCHFQAAVVRTVRELFRDGESGPLRLQDLTPEAARTAIAQLALSPSRVEIDFIGNLMHSADFDHSTFTPLVPRLTPPGSREAVAHELRREHWMVATARAWIEQASGQLREETLRATRDVLSELGERRLRQFH